MSRTRYEPVPQRDESISLDNISSISGYNYNSGIPNSVPSSAAPSYYGDGPQVHAPSIRSIPNSPPPSFHTHSSPGTPRPTPSTTAQGDYAELWGVAASTTGAPTEAFTPSPLATIATLQARISRLEESVGRLLLEKEEGESITYQGGNCCISFTDASPSLERGMSAAGGNCCIHFRSSKIDKAQQERQRQKWALAAVCAITFTICMMFVLIAAVKKDHKKAG